MKKVTKPIPDLLDEPRLDDIEPKHSKDREHIELAGMESTSVEKSSGKYLYVDISDCALVDALLNNVSTFRSGILRSTFKHSQLTGLQLPEGHFKHVMFEDCRINLANFRNSKFDRCIFRDCDLSEADFGGSTLEKVLFENCNLVQTEFSNVTAKRLEFDSCKLGSIKGASGLRGSLIDEVNLAELAPLLAKEMNIKVRLLD